LGVFHRALVVKNAGPLILGAFLRVYLPWDGEKRKKLRCRLRKFGNFDNGFVWDKKVSFVAL